MGVRGWRRFLAETGWLPTEARSWDVNWREEGQEEEEEDEASGGGTGRAGREETTIPAHSVLLIDGYGLAFHVQRVAYERHVRREMADAGSSSRCYSR